MKNARPAANDPPILVLFRNDLRLADNAALAAAADSGRTVVPVFVLDPEPAGRPRGSASRWWLHHSLEALASGLDALGAGLTLRAGQLGTALDRLIDETKTDRIQWNRNHDPADLRDDDGLIRVLGKRGIAVEAFDGQLLHDPARLTTGSGGHYKVYTPFWRALSALPEPRDPIDAPKAIRPFDRPLHSLTIDDLNLLPKSPDWATGLRDRWTPGEAGAQRRLSAFLGDGLAGYGEARDLPGRQGTSMLSPHLAHGEITPFQILARLRNSGVAAKNRADAEKFRKELCWREFNYHQLFHNPDLATANFNHAFDAFPWAGEETDLRSWQRGRTGYPIVDAGMRELWQTGWMHNRVRLIVGSFLAKHLLTDWRKGETWFWDTLVDADAANNPGNWQWVAGSGADASPYFRIFNPILQGEKFDPDGAYVRRYVPEVGRLPDKFIHRPWTASRAALDEAGVKLGETYPVPLIDHNQARDRAMQAFRTMRGPR